MKPHLALLGRCLGAALATATLPPGAAAQSLLAPAPGRPVEIELRSAVRAVAPGDTIPVAIRVRPDAGWRAYWRQAGDIGSAPVVTWKLPAGYTAAPIRWPMPVRYEAPPLASYVYRDEVHLLAAVHVPATARVGSTATLTASLAWVVSGAVCIPGEGEFTLTVPVAARTVVDEGVARVFAAEAARVPVRRDGWAFRAAVDRTHLLLHVETPADVRGAFARRTPRAQFFIDSASVIDHAAEPVVRTTARGLELRIPRSRFATHAPTRITGVLALDTTSTRRNAPRVTLEVDARVDGSR